jgi:uncharacterized protein YuzE
VFTTQQYRAKAAEYSELAKQVNDPNEVIEFQKLERSFTMLADNEQWIADNRNKLANNLDEVMHVPKYSRAGEATSLAEVEHMIDDSQEKSETDRHEGCQIIEYNEQKEIVTIELHRKLLQHPQQLEAIIKHFVEIIEHGPNLKHAILLTPPR